MITRFLVILCIIIVSFATFGCNSPSQSPKIGVSFGVGSADRWEQEKIYMQERAQELNLDIEVLINRTDTPKTQIEDCMDLIDSGIQVLIITPKNATAMGDVLTHAKKKGVKVIAYARPIEGDSIRLFIGCDNYKLGQQLGQHLIEKVYRGNIIILRGDPYDYSARLLYEGSMEYITSLGGNNIKIILDAPVPKRSKDVAKQMVIDALLKNNKEIHAILAPNDKIAGVCREALEELNITNPVLLSGIDAELTALKRIIDDKQDSTVYMNLKELSTLAIDEANNIIKNNKVTTNAEFTTKQGNVLPTYLISSQIIIKENIDKNLIESGVYTKEQVYGKQ